MGITNLDNSFIESLLEQTLLNTQELLGAFILDVQSLHKLQLVFGDDVDLAQAVSIVQDLTQSDSVLLPRIEIRSTSEINGANGAFAGDNYTIYLAQEFIEQNAENAAAITTVLLEELSHAIDFQLHPHGDTRGDEGELLSALVRDVALSTGDIQRIQTEDDRAIVTIDGYEVEIEQATLGVNPAFDLIGLTQLRNDPQFSGLGLDGSGFTVAVLDTGLDATHPNIRPNFVAFADFVDGVSDPPLITNANATYDSGSHGTHVAGTVGASNENLGVAPDVGLIGLRVLGPNTTGASVRDALQWVLDNHKEYDIVAVNMSLGFGDFFLTNNIAFENENNENNGGLFTEINDIIQRLEMSGVTVVSAAGNSYIVEQKPGVGFPAISSTINVGAVWQDGVNSHIPWSAGSIDFTTGTDRITSFSQRLNEPNDIFDTLFAPGALINSARPGGGTLESGGTSQASPHVAGAVAVLQEAATIFGGRLLSPDEIVDILFSTADSIFDGDDEHDNVLNTNTNYGRLNIYNAVVELQRRFEEIGGEAGDPNGTIVGAFLGPRIDGSSLEPLLGSIGTDGGTTNVGDRDVDIFRFEVAVPGNVTIEVGSHPNNPNDFDTVLRLFDPFGNEIGFDDDDGEGSFSRLEVALDPGTYYAGISGYSNLNYDPNVPSSGVSGATGNYSLQFSLGNTDPNGILAGAVPINLGSDIDPFELLEGFIGADRGQPIGTADVDLFRVIVPDDGTLIVDIDTPFSTDYVDSFLRIFEADGRQAFFEDTGEIIISDDDLSFNPINGIETEFTDTRFPDLVFEDPFNRTFFHGHTTDSFIAGTVERGNVYYIGVSDWRNQDYNTQNFANRSTDGTGGFYDLKVQFINNDRNGSIAQAVPNAPISLTGQSGTIGVDQDPTSGDVFQVGDLDVDFVKVRSATAGILEIDVDAYEAVSIINPVDAVAFIFDADGNLLGFNDDADSLDPRLQYRINANTDYFVAIAGFGNNNFDPFFLGSGSSGDTGDYLFNSRLRPLSDVSVISDNTIASGAVQDISIDSFIFGEIGQDDTYIADAEDIDIYRFVSDFNGIVEIQTNAFEEFSSDTYLRFFDVAGNEIAFNDNAGSSTAGSLIQANINQGQTYYIGVNGSSDQARNYNPVTGGNAAPGSQGTYILSAEIVTGFSTLEASGNTQLVKDSQDQLYAQVGNNPPNPIKLGGQSISDGQIPGWELLAVETINGQNQALWKNGPGNFLSLWSLDNNWNWQTSIGQWDVNSAEAFSLEIDFQTDTNGDFLIGTAFSTLESSGNTDLLRDPFNRLYAQVGAQTPRPIKFGGQSIAVGQFPGWELLAVETINGQNQALWKNGLGNFLSLWSLDNNWNWQASIGQWDANSAEAISLEIDFQTDANGDQLIGTSFLALESSGNTDLLRDPFNRLYAQVGTQTPRPIKLGGQSIADGQIPGWELLAVETINGQNQALWKNEPGNFLSLWRLDNNWNWQASIGLWNVNSAEAFSLEIDFQTDANGDQLIGTSFLALESLGNTDLLLDPFNRLYAQVGTQTPTTIKLGGQSIVTGQIPGWELLAVESINGQNQALWKNGPGNFLSLWRLDNNWNWQASIGQWSVNSVEASGLETAFQTDANGDQLIGAPFSAFRDSSNSSILG